MWVGVGVGVGVGGDVGPWGALDDVVDAQNHVGGLGGADDHILHDAQGDETFFWFLFVCGLRRSVAIRSSFVPPEGYVFVSADYRHLELRLMAHFSQVGIHDRTFKAMHPSSRSSPLLIPFCGTSSTRLLASSNTAQGPFRITPLITHGPVSSRAHPSQPHRALHGAYVPDSRCSLAVSRRTHPASALRTAYCLPS